MTGIPSWAVKGAKVVCTRDFATARVVDDRGYRATPTILQVYEVSSAFMCRFDLPVITLTEFEGDHYFDVRGFAPVVSDDVEASIFKHLHQRVPEKA